MTECPYCHTNRALLLTDNGTLHIAFGELLEDVSWDYGEDRPSDECNARVINYCPMCGRRLSNE